MKSNRVKWLAVSAGVGILLSTSAGREQVSAQTTDPTTLGLVTPSDLTYLGAFRVPLTNFGGSNFRYTGFGMVYNPVRNSLFVTGNSMQQMTAEIAIPAGYSTTGSLAALPVAPVLQPFVDATEGKLGLLGTDVKIGGYLIDGGRLYMDGYVYYDGSGSQSVSHFSRPLDLSSTGDVKGPYTMMDGANNATGYTSGPMGAIPGAWQSLLGGTAVTEQCCIAIISRTSWGPSFFSWTPSSFARSTPVYPSLWYNEQHPLDVFDAASGVFNGTTQIHGIVFPEGTRSVLYFGRQGTTYGYGNGVSMTPPTPPVDGNVASGTGASTDVAGTTITLPNANVSAAVGEWLWLSSQTTPNYDGGHPGVAQVISYANSGTPTANVKVASAFSAGLTGQTYSLGNINLYDPLDPNKGNHGYPYRSQVWAYSAYDMLAVRRGAKQAWQLRPYATWALSAPFFNGTGAINGAAYDSISSRVYLLMPNIDGTSQDFPIVLVYKTSATAQPTPPTSVHIVR